MPNNRDPGALEDFVGALIRPAEVLWEYSRDVVAHAPETPSRFAAHDRAKAHLYTWLALQSDPGLRLQRAAERGKLDSSAPPALALLHWLERLYSEPLDGGS
jgi:hypothetical protein